MNMYEDDALIKVCLECPNETCSPERCSRFAAAVCDEKECGRGREPVLYTYNGVAKTALEWADATGMNPSTLRNRLRHGMTISEALGCPVRVQQPLTVQGKKYTVQEIARITGLTRQAVRYRLGRESAESLVSRGRLKGRR